MAAGMLKRLGIEVEAYDPLIGAGIAALIRPNTALVWTESPGSVTMEVQDVPAICEAARAAYRWRWTTPMPPACCSTPSRMAWTSASRP